MEMESPVREVPTPTMGAPPPVKLVADWLDTPNEEDEEGDEDVALPGV